MTYTSRPMKNPLRHREERSDVAIQSPSFKQGDWIAALPAVARNDEGGGTRESFHRAVGIKYTV